MIKEAYVSFEVAKLLKEKGFDVTCHSHFWENKYKVYVDNRAINWNFVKFGWLSRPTHQMALAWLREKGIMICVSPDIKDSHRVYPEIYIKGEECYQHYEKLFVMFHTYEEAVEAALKYSLENLI